MKAKILLIIALAILLTPLAFNFVSAQPAPKAPSEPVTPKIVQTQDANFKISPHEVTTADSYVYVTPYGNYSFSQSKPWLTKYTSLQGDSAVTFSAFGVTQIAILKPSSSTVTIQPTKFVVNTTMQTLVGSVTRGYLAVTWDFAKSPPKATTHFTKISGLDFNIFWVLAGYKYATVDKSSVFDASTQIGLNSFSASASRIYLSPSSSDLSKVLKIDVSDYGAVSALYGKLSYDGTDYYGVYVPFGTNIATVDPSLVQSNSCTGLSCAFSSNVTSGNLIVVGVGEADSTTTCGTNTISDTRSTSFTSINTASQAGTTNCMYTQMWYGRLASSGSDTVTVTYSRTSVGSQLAIYEFSGGSTSGITSATGAGSGAPPTYATSSLTFGANAILVAIVCSGEGTVGTFSPGTGFTQNGSGGCGQSASEYALSGITSPTTFPFTVTGNSGTQYFSEVGVQIPPQTSQTVTLTVSPVGATQATFTLSGGGVNPTSVAGDGTAKTINCDNGATITTTAPSDGSNTRHRFSPISTTWAFTCDTNNDSNTYYFQLQNTYQATPKAQTTWESGLSALAISGTVLGSASTTVCSITLTAGTGAQSCSSWADYNLAVSFGSITGGPVNTRRQSVAPTSFTQTTGGNTNNVDWYLQNSMTASYSLDSGTFTAPTLTYIALGSSSTLLLTTIGQTVWPDANTNWSTTNPLALSGSTERAQANSGDLGSSAAGGTIGPAYTHQYSNNFAYSLAGGGTFTPPTLSGNSFGSSTSVSVPTVSTGVWFDSGITPTITNPLTGSSASATERAQTQTAVPTINSGGGSTTFGYYHQYLVTNPNSLTLASPTQFGSAGASSTTDTWVDSGGSFTCSCTYSQSWTVTYASWIYDVTAASIGIQILGDQAVSAISWVTSDANNPYLRFTTVSSSAVKGFIPSAASLTFSKVTNAGSANSGATFSSNILTETGVSPHEWDFTTGSAPSGGTTPSGGGGGGGGGGFVIPPISPTNATETVAPVPTVSPDYQRLALLLIIGTVGSAIVVGLFNTRKRGGYRIPVVDEPRYRTPSRGKAKYRRPR